ncbi:hypothetical protein ACSHWB_15665 [Lentzea sp. HUAS TT2]|uniref:hypothetical protein n=1 Tax=Lentzea sp. HUAS TT2 TaxID=3447454 RepID=UPI003F7217B3
MSVASAIPSGAGGLDNVGGLRAALNDAIAQQIITFNPAAHVEIEPGKRPKALV